MNDADRGGGGWSEDDLPWTYENFEIGDRVTWSEKALRRNVPTHSRRGIKGYVTKLEVGKNGETYTIKVIWDGYKHPHKYAGCFIAKTKY